MTGDVTILTQYVPASRQGLNALAHALVATPQRIRGRHDRRCAPAIDLSPQLPALIAQGIHQHGQIREWHVPLTQALTALEPVPRSPEPHAELIERTDMTLECPDHDLARTRRTSAMESATRCSTLVNAYHSSRPCMGRSPPLPWALP